MLEHIVCIGAGIISTEFASKILGISDLHRVCASGIGCVNEIGQNFSKYQHKPHPDAPACTRFEP